MQKSGKIKRGLWLKALLCLILVVGLYGTFNHRPISLSVDNHLAKIRSNDLTEAYYGYMSKNFRSMTSLGEFRRFVRSTPILRTNRGFTIEQRTLDEPFAVLKGFLISDNGEQVPVEFQLIQEDNDWKIFGLELLKQHSQDIEPEELTGMVRKQILAIHDGDLQSAYYGLVASRFEERTPFPTFEALVNEYPFLQSFDSLDIEAPILEKGHATVRAILKKDDLLYSIDYKLVNEGGKWKIWSLKLTLPKGMENSYAGTLLEPVRKHLRALSQHDYAKAYERTSPSFQSTTSSDSFRSFIDTFPVLTRHTMVTFGTPFIEGEKGKVQIGLTSDETFAIMEFTLANTGGVWEIQNIQIYPTK